MDEKERAYAGYQDARKRNDPSSADEAYLAGYQWGAYQRSFSDFKLPEAVTESNETAEAAVERVA